MNAVTLRSGNVPAKAADMAAKKDELDAMISIRISKADVKAMDRLADILPMKPITIARTALRLGLVALEADPWRMAREATEVRDRPRRASPKPKPRRGR